MRKYLLPKDGTFYKANLHCHSTVSDGGLTPEELKKAYMAEGYSIIAYTDHNVFIHHPELCDENFLPLNGYELDINEPGFEGATYADIKTCHLCYIALEPDNDKIVCWHRSKYRSPVNEGRYSAQTKFDENEPDYERIYNAECINDMIRRGRQAGFFVTYNHPTWSREGFTEYGRYEGMNAMEICNFGCIAVGYDDYNPHEYDEFLHQGKRIYCIATDDNHNHGTPGTRSWDSFGGFTYIKADKLEYRTITKALEEGHFYASQGPEIRELWFEEGLLHVSCSPAEKIICIAGRRGGQINWAEEGESVTEATFRVDPKDGYVRVEVIDHHGRPANTNAYFCDELFAD